MIGAESARLKGWSTRERTRRGRLVRTAGDLKCNIWKGGLMRVRQKPLRLPGSQTGAKQAEKKTKQKKAKAWGGIRMKSNF